MGMTLNLLKTPVRLPALQDVSQYFLMQIQVALTLSCCIPIEGCLVPFILTMDCCCFTSDTGYLCCLLKLLLKVATSQTSISLEVPILFPHPPFSQRCPLWFPHNPRLSLLLFSSLVAGFGSVSGGLKLSYTAVKLLHA